LALCTYRADKIEVSFDGDICTHAAFPTERLRRIRLVEIVDDRDDAAVMACELRYHPVDQAPAQASARTVNGS
jgi:hypothetical protein